MIGKLLLIIGVVLAILTLPVMPVYELHGDDVVCYSSVLPVSPYADCFCDYVNVTTSYCDVHYGIYGYE